MDHDKIKIIEVNSRYHEKRYLFFNRLSLLQRFIILAFGMSLTWIFFSGYINHYSGYVTAILAFLTAFDLTIDFTEKKYVHKRLSHEYLKLLRKYKNIHAEEVHNEILLNYGKQMLDEERPPRLDSLYAIQYNIVFGHQRYAVRWWNRIFCQLFSYVYRNPLEDYRARDHLIQSLINDSIEDN